MTLAEPSASSQMTLAGNWLMCRRVCVLGYVLCVRCVCYVYGLMVRSMWYVICVCPNANANANAIGYVS